LPGRLTEVLRKIGQPKILLIGDLILDRYVWGEVQRVSPEAPIQVLDVISEEEARPGGAGSVALNLSHLGASVLCCSVTGDDENGTILKEKLEQAGVNAKAIYADRNRPTPVKTRYLGYVQSAHRAEQHLLRVDHEKRHPISKKLEERLARHIRRTVPSCNCVIIADYNKGLLTKRLLRETISSAKKARVPVVVDPRRPEKPEDNFTIYRGAFAITPNRFETQLATGVQVLNERSARKAGRRLVEKFKIQHAVITLDKDGIFLYSRGGNGKMFPTQPREVTDVTGAGDMVVAVIGLVVAGEGSCEDAARLANIAAGIEVGKMGVVPVGRQEIIRELHIQKGELSDKIIPFDEIDDVLRVHRQRKEKIVFTNGCFDILHAGHVRYLEFARAQGDLLVVGLNSDKSVRKIKGSKRPVVPERQRAEVLAGLASVDYIVLFDEPTPLKLIRKVKPDIIVKGEEWREKGVVGGGFVESRGGKVVFAPMVEGESTSGIISKILRLHGLEKGDG